MVNISVCSTHLHNVSNNLPKNKTLSFIEPNDAKDECISSQTKRVIMGALNLRKCVGGMLFTIHTNISDQLRDPKSVVCVGFPTIITTFANNAKNLHLQRQTTDINQTKLERVCTHEAMFLLSVWCGPSAHAQDHFDGYTYLTTHNFKCCSIVCIPF